MALGDGTTWSTAIPTTGQLVYNIATEIRDLRIGIAGRMAHEHNFPASQTATASGGKHTFVTLVAATTPSALISGTQIAAIVAMSSGTGYEVFMASVSSGTTAGSAVQITRTGNIGPVNFVMATTADPASPAAGQIWFRSDLV